MHDSGYGLLRIVLLKLSEKGYEQRSEREFGGVRRQNGPKSSVSVLRKATQQAPPTLFGQFLYVFR
jgi:hypothetical protein